MLNTNKLLHNNPTNRLEIYHSPLLLEVIGLIERSHMTAEKIAEKAGVSPNTLTRWLGQKVHRPRIDTLEKVAETLGYQVMLVQKAKGRH